MESFNTWDSVFPGAKPTESRTHNCDKSLAASLSIRDHAQPPSFNSTASTEAGNMLTVEEQRNLLEDMDDSGLLRSFDMIFEVHKRSEQVRKELDKIDSILLTSRSVGHLIDQVVHVLRTDMDLPAAYFAFKHSHPLALFARQAKTGYAAVIPDAYFEDERFGQASSFVLTDPSDPLGKHFFGDRWNEIRSAAVGNLQTETEKIGAICLAGSDPYRYRRDMNIDLLSSLAEKISIGLLNARDHEINSCGIISNGPDRVHSEEFFLEYLQKEFYRACREDSCYALMSLAWKTAQETERRTLDQIASFVGKNIRSTDLLARCGKDDLWVLLPATQISGAKIVADRLIDIVHSKFRGSTIFHFGISGFSKDIQVIDTMIDQARSALETAGLSDTNRTELYGIENFAEDSMPPAKRIPKKRSRRSVSGACSAT